MKAKLTRREIVVAGGLGMAGAAAASLPEQASAAPASGDASARQHDLRVLETLQRIEHALDYAYHRVLSSWSFNSSTRGILELILRHEAEHAAVVQERMADLASGLSSAEQAAARPRGSASPLDAVTSLLQGAQTPRDGMRALTKIEALSEAEYFHAVGEFHSPELSLLAARILASEAQHWSLLMNVLTEGKLPQIVPLAFVRGVGGISS